MIISEIHYRLLLGQLGNRLRTISTHGSRSHKIAEAIDWFKSNYTEPLKIDMLADKVNMASSTFRRHFKFVTTLSPLQYQKRLRLYEVRRLMLASGHNATSACYAVVTKALPSLTESIKKCLATRLTKMCYEKLLYRLSHRSELSIKRRLMEAF